MNKFSILALVAVFASAGCNQESAAAPTVTPDQAKSQGFKAPPAPNAAGGGAAGGNANVPKSNQATATTD